MYISIGLKLDKTFITVMYLKYLGMVPLTGLFMIDRIHDPMSSRARVKRLTGIKSDLDVVRYRCCHKTREHTSPVQCISTVKGQRGTGSRKDEHITIQRRLSRKTWPKALRTSDWDNDLHQAKTMQKCFRDDCEYRVAQTEPRFEKPENVCPLAVPIQPDTA